MDPIWGSRLLKSLPSVSQRLLPRWLLRLSSLWVESSMSSRSLFEQSSVKCCKETHRLRIGVYWLKADNWVSGLHFKQARGNWPSAAFSKDIVDQGNEWWNACCSLFVGIVSLDNPVKTGLLTPVQHIRLQQGLIKCPCTFPDTLRQLFHIDKWWHLRLYDDILIVQSKIINTNICSEAVTNICWHLRREKDISPGVINHKLYNLR